MSDCSIPDGFETPKQFGDRVGIREEQVRTWVKDGLVPAIRLGRLILIPEDALARILARQEENRGAR